MVSAQDPKRILSWILSDGRALAARLDFPADGDVGGAVIVVPSLGQEAVVAFRTTRSLTMHAARAGFVGITFSFSGEGDSHPLPTRIEVVEAWRADLTAVVSMARHLVGADRPVHLVGLRVGAAILRSLPPTGSGVRVLWEPVSGASYLRQHRTIRKHTIALPVATGGVELDGSFVSTQQAESLKRLLAPGRRDTAREGEVLRFETDRGAARRIALGSPYYALLPLEDIQRIVASLPLGDLGAIAPWKPLLNAELRTRRGDVVVETLSEIGPKKLPGVLAMSPEVPVRVKLLLTAMGSELRSGPGNLWTNCARQLAGEGVMTLRADRGGIGDDVDPCRIEEPRPYVEGSVDDIVAGITHLRDQGRSWDGHVPVWATGVCAGAWSVFRASRRCTIDRIISVNSIHWHPNPAVYDEAFYRRFHGDDTPSILNETPTADTDPSGRRLARVNRAARFHIAVHFPWIRALLRSDVPHETVNMLLSQVPQDTHVDLIMGTRELQLFLGKGGRRAVRKARNRGLSVVTTTSPLLDHALLSAIALDTVQRRLHALVAQRADSGITAGALMKTPQPDGRRLISDRPVVGWSRGS